MAIVFGLILFVTTSEGGPAGSSIWTVLVHSLDPGVLSNSNGSSWFLFILLVVTLLGLFSVGTLISIITASMSKALDQLSHGKSKIVERKNIYYSLGIMKLALRFYGISLSIMKRTKVFRLVSNR